MSASGTAAGQPHPAIPVHASIPISSAPPAKISSQCHLDPSSYVKGGHQLTIEANAVIHPRTYLFTELGPITIRQGSIITEKCVIGRRDKSESTTTKPPPPTGRDPSVDPADKAKAQPQPNFPEIIIGPNAHLHASVTVQAPSVINDSTVLEPGVMISPNCTIGAHSKICAGITIPPGTTIPEWTVVYGIHGQMRRRRQDDLAEEARLDVLARERQAVEAILKSNATKNLAQGSSGSLKSKRESMIRG